jgi:activator of HSP90 ATPase
VEDREDGNNVNGWHWQEKNMLPWSRQKIDELMRGLTANLDDTLGSAEVVGIKDLTGEVCDNPRRQQQSLCSSQCFCLHVIPQCAHALLEDMTLNMTLTLQCLFLIRLT